MYCLILINIIDYVAVITTVIIIQVIILLAALSRRWGAPCVRTRTACALRMSTSISRWSSGMEGFASAMSSSSARCPSSSCSAVGGPATSGALNAIFPATLIYHKTPSLTEVESDAEKIKRVHVNAEPGLTDIAHDRLCSLCIQSWLVLVWVGGYYRGCPWSSRTPLGVAPK